MTRTVLSLGNFFAAAQLFLVIFILGPYLSQSLPAAETGLVIASGAVLALIMFPLMPDVIARYDARRLLIALSIVEAAALLWLAAAPSAIVTLLLVALATALPSIISYLLDLMLEATVRQESSTGTVRTMFLTAGNVAIVLGTLATGFILTSEDSYAIVFFAGAIALLPLIFLFIARRIPQSMPPQKARLHATVMRMLGNEDLRSVSLSYLVLQSFYQMTRLYIPLYFHDVLGMSWGPLAWLLALSLLPFILFEYPAGRALDRHVDDREFLFIGFIGTGFAYAMIAFMTASTSYAFVLGAFIAMNTCAVLVEAATESHFFRLVSEKDASTIGAFRMLRPFSALAAPLIGSALLALFGYSWLFTLTGTLIIGLGSFAALRLSGTR
ncbi:MAG TPA: MFS transporter [Candidatus Paceibacterota bacterium]